MSEAPSQFFPGTSVQFAWDSVSLGDFKKCPRYYYYTHILGYSTKEESIHLRFGIEYHQALHDYETSRINGIEHDDAVHDVVRELLCRVFDWEPDFTSKAYQTKNKDSLVRTVIWYLDKFRNDPAETYVLENGKPAIEVSFRWELNFGPKEQPDYPAVQPYILCGHLDRIVNYQGELYVMDRKTTGSSLGSYYYSQFEPNNQMTIYSASSQVVISSPVKGVIIDAVQVKAEDSIFGRGFTYRTPEQLDEWFVGLHQWLATAEAYATKGEWPMNDTSCTMYGGCRFRDICSKSPSTREKFLDGNFIKLEEKDRWNPLKSR